MPRPRAHFDVDGMGIYDVVTSSEVVEGFGTMEFVVWVLSSVGIWIWPGRTALIGFGVEVSGICFEDDVFGTCEDTPLSEMAEGFMPMPSVVWVISSVGIWPGRTALIGFGIEVSGICFKVDVIGTCEDIPLSVIVEGFGAMNSVVWVISSEGI